MRSICGKITSSLVILSLVCILEALTHETLFNYSQELIPKLQGEATVKELDAWNIYSYWAQKLISYGPILVAYALVTERGRALYYLVCSCGSEALTELIKLIAIQERPFWVANTKVKLDTLACTGQYGDPSGHSAITMAMCVAIWLDLSSQPAHESRSTPKRAIYAIVAFLLPISIGYSRLVIGVHSLNQILFGLELGLWYALTAHYLIRDALMDLTQRIVDAKEHASACFYAEIGTLITIAIIGSQVIVYELASHYFKNPDVWRDQIVAFCGSDYLEGAFQKYGIQNIGQVGLSQSAFYGILAQQKYTPALISGKALQNDSWLHYAARIALALALVVPWRHFDDWFVKGRVDNAYAYFLLGSFLPSLAQGFFLFFLADLIGNKLGLFEMQNYETNRQQQSKERPGEKTRGQMDEETLGLLQQTL